MVDFELDPAQNAWLAQVREFLRQSVTPALRSELAEHGQEFPGGEVASFLRKIGERGWFGLNWSPEYGGLGLGAFEYALVTEELARAWVSVATSINASAYNPAAGSSRHRDSSQAATRRLGRTDSVSSSRRISSLPAK